MKILGRLLNREGSPSAVPLGDGAPRGAGIEVGACTALSGGPDPNEDALLTLQGAISRGEELMPLCACIVADGMGGHAGGRTASDLAVRLVGEWIVNRIYRPFLSQPDHPGGRQPARC
jgi:hypothetical protein